MNALAQGGGKKKKIFNTLLESLFLEQIHVLLCNPSTIHEKFSVIHSWQDNILLLDDFADYICHVGNAYEMHSIIQSGLIPRGRSNRKDRQSVFFTAVYPLDIQPDRREVEYMIWTNPESHRTKKTWRSHHNTVFRCTLQFAHRKGLRFYHSFRHTTSDLYRQSGLHENKGRSSLQNTRVTQVTSRNTRAELATRSEGCTYHRF